MATEIFKSPQFSLTHYKSQLKDIYITLHMKRTDFDPCSNSYFNLKFLFHVESNRL